MNNKVDWRGLWADAGMPEFVSEDMQGHILKVNLFNRRDYKGYQAHVTIHFHKDDNLLDNLKAVSRLLGRDISPKTKDIVLDVNETELAQLLFGGACGVQRIRNHSTWFPWRGREKPSDYVVRSVNDRGEKVIVNPKYPVYIISKSRWKWPITARELERMDVPYSIVVEPKEYENYVGAFAKGFDGGKKFLGTIVKAPENFSERGQGSIPVRNYVWDLAIEKAGIHGRHWLMDDNIAAFYYYNKNVHTRVATGAIFHAVEIFADRFTNVALAGLQNNQFVVAKQKWPAFVINTRVYSCTLIKNDLDLRLPSYVGENHEGKKVYVPACTEPRWRGRYNEDTDLCIRALKRGWCTALFNVFNSDKVTTMTMTGGNTDELYGGKNIQTRRKSAESAGAPQREEAA